MVAKTVEAAVTSSSGAITGDDDVKPLFTSIAAGESTKISAPAEGSGEHIVEFLKWEDCAIIHGYIFNQMKHSTHD